MNGTIPVDLDAPTQVGDYDGDGVPDLMVKFNRAEVVDYIFANVNVTELKQSKRMNVVLTVAGKLNDGTTFQGSDTIRILYCGKGGPGRNGRLK